MASFREGVFVRADVRLFGRAMRADAREVRTSARTNRSPVWAGSTPSAAGDLDSASACGVVLEAVVNPGAAHSSGGHEVGD